MDVVEYQIDDDTLAMYIYRDTKHQIVRRYYQEYQRQLREILVNLKSSSSKVPLAYQDHDNFLQPEMA